MLPIGKGGPTFGIDYSKVRGDDILNLFEIRRLWDLDLSGAGLGLPEEVTTY